MAGEKFYELTLFERFAEKSWQISRSANRLLIVSNNLDGFSLANHRRFAKFAELSPHQTFLLYGMYFSDLLILLQVDRYNVGRCPWSTILIVYLGKINYFKIMFC